MKCFFICGMSFIALLVLMALILFIANGGALTGALGKGLYDINPIIINLPQAIIQRYIWSDLWIIIFVPLLKLNAWKAFLLLFLIPSIISIITKAWSQRCQKQKN